MTELIYKLICRIPTTNMMKVTESRLFIISVKFEVGVTDNTLTLQAYIVCLELRCAPLDAVSCRCTQSSPDRFSR